ncbi:hypothetical protein HanIR_Chr04g0200971 [Helianthus annuus]|nr:hypothetical protein HanIR_Chr04g0200971 [Helianthus annuus]
MQMIKLIVCLERKPWNALVWLEWLLGRKNSETMLSRYVSRKNDDLYGLQCGRYYMFVLSHPRNSRDLRLVKIYIKTCTLSSSLTLSLSSLSICGGDAPPPPPYPSPPPPPPYPSPPPSLPTTTAAIPFNSTSTNITATIITTIPFTPSPPPPQPPPCSSVAADQNPPQPPSQI